MGSDGVVGWEGLKWTHSSKLCIIDLTWQNAARTDLL